MVIISFYVGSPVGFYDSFKKKALDGNAVIPVLFLNTLFHRLFSFRS